MKKTLIIPMLVVMFIIMATTSVFANGNLADEIYNMGKAYGVTAEHKVEMERFFNDHPATEEQRSYIISKAKEAIAVMDEAGVKDVTKLSEADQKKVQGLVTSAADKIGVSVTFSVEGNEVVANISKNGAAKKYESTFKASTGSTTSSSSKKYVYTGANNGTIVFSVISLGVIAIAGAVVVKLKKNA